jgi:tetratricopeptide (TPR) repeat protein
MVGASSSWRIAVMRPGEDPIGHLAAAISARDILGIDDEEMASTNRVLAEATLRRGPLGLAHAVRQARIPEGENLLVIVDQFEELFRFRHSRHANSRDEAIAFVRLLLEAPKHQDVPVYIVLTMRSDFIGDCMEFPGLSEAVNAGMYLVGRMSRDALRSAITGPVAVGGGTIAPRLVHRVLNDLGDDQDQLPRVQHALMRTWDHWQRTRTGDAPIDVIDYEAIGTFQDALSNHAEEAYQEAVSTGHARVAEHMFKALTDTFSDARGVRRPTPVLELGPVCEASERDIEATINIFRRVGRSFLMPPAAIPLGPHSIVDLSHESLMRCWSRLIGWAEEERQSATFYVRLSQAAAWFEAGSAGLWRNPELELAQQWRTANQPTAAWARRYDDSFDRAMAFLDRSLQARADEEQARERERRAKLKLVQWTAAVLAVFLFAAIGAALFAWRERTRAEGNLALARAAVDETLSSADQDPARVGADLPQVEEFRRQLLSKAQEFYVAFMNQAPRSEESRRDLAFGHFRLGHINRLMEKPDDAAREYQDAIGRFETLASSYPENPEYRAALANSFNWLGETLRPQPARFAEARNAYDNALKLQQVLTTEHSDSRQYHEELARTHYNRGILLSSQPEQLQAAEADFREAVRLLEPLSVQEDRAAQELARAYNNLGSLLSFDPPRVNEVIDLWQKAIAIDERLAVKDPSNREYKLELAAYCGNLAALLYEQRRFAEADRWSRQALELTESLARLAPSLAVARADAHSLRGMTLVPLDEAGAEREFAAALDLFDQMHNDQNVVRLPGFLQRFGDLLLNLAVFPSESENPARANQLLARAARVYAEVAAAVAASGSRADVQNAFDNLSRVIPAVPEPERGRLVAASEQLQQKLGESGTGR